MTLIALHYLAMRALPDRSIEEITLLPGLRKCNIRVVKDVARSMIANGQSCGIKC